MDSDLQRSVVHKHSAVACDFWPLLHATRGCLRLFKRLFLTDCNVLLQRRQGDDDCNFRLEDQRWEDRMGRQRCVICAALRVRPLSSERGCENPFEFEAYSTMNCHSTRNRHSAAVLPLLTARSVFRPGLAARPTEVLQQLLHCHTLRMQSTSLHSSRQQHFRIPHIQCRSGANRPPSA